MLPSRRIKYARYGPDQQLPLFLLGYQLFLASFCERVILSALIIS
jgi:hypothetical protein